jgi:hypothetical protein
VTMAGMNSLGVDSMVQVCVFLATCVGATGAKAILRMEQVQMRGYVMRETINWGRSTGYGCRF